MKRIMFFAVTLALLLSACGNKTTPIGNGGVPRAWVDQPLDGSVFPIGAVVHITTHASDVQGISKVAIYVGADLLDTGSIPEGQTYVLLDQDWVPKEAGTYIITTRSQSTAGQWSTDASVTIEILPKPTEPPKPRFTVAPSQTPGGRPLVTPSTTPTPTPAGPLTFTFIKNAFCRKGPAVSFSEVTGISAGETVNLLNVSEDGFWYYIYWERFNAKCWVAASTGQVNGDLSGIGVLAGPTPIGPSPVGPAAPPPDQPTLVPTRVPTATDFKP